MNGIAIIIPDADFSEHNLGTVSFLQEVDVLSISIVAESSYETLTFTPTVSYQPALTNQTGVTWSLDSGSTYASINSATGQVTIKSGANNNDIVVKATSVYNNQITATKTIAVTYKDTVDELNSITVSATKTERNKYTLSVAYNPINSSMTGVTYSITSGSSYASINGTELTVLNTASTQQTITITAISTVDPSVTDTLSLNVVYEQEPSWNLDEKIGVIEGVNSGLFAAMTSNYSTILIQFTDDSTKSPTHSHVGVFSMGGSDNNPQNYGIPYAGMWINWSGHVLMQTNALKGSGWTAGRNGSNGSNTINRYKYDGDSGRPQPIDINGKTFIMTQESTSGSSMYLDGVQLTPWTTQSFLPYLKYLSFGWITGTQNSTDYNTCAEVYTGIGTNPNSEPGAAEGVIKIKKFIIVPGTYTTEEDVLAARENAYVDIQFDNNGDPYNAGSMGTLMLANVSDLSNQ